MGGDIIHASVTGHQASPMKQAAPKVYFNGGGDVEVKGCVNDGVSHIDMEGNAWSAQFKHWFMHRKLIPNESFKGKFVPPTE